MKFSDGYWLLRPGVEGAYPVEVRDVTAGNGEVVVHASTHPIRHRGDTLKGPVVTLGLTSPMADVVGVRITHFSGETPREPSFALARCPAGTRPPPPTPAAATP
ncbi:hypothetical protein AB0G02_35475, partial [Actinosynnema sp. NPDC023658]